MDITVTELKDKIDQGYLPVMIDVREPHEWDRDVLPQAKKISLGDLPQNLEQLAQFQEEEVVLICRSGRRSDNATRFLQARGFLNARNLAGGMLAWKKEIDPAFDVS
ncbi:MAG: rhodanese-like domain-containing protein [Bacteroidetes bacterium]|nr:rhodanese-like domain-containing protein [Bacteroidota bacterium]MCB0844454.1 rhodanese-like domain-containing protein [Bacteroidota bacterium]MCB0856451.1 rhodanese-like domain-containing protein [Bacteroidota bacterium]